MIYLVEIFVSRVNAWVPAPVFFNSAAEADAYCDQRADKITRVTARRR